MTDPSFGPDDERFAVEALDRAVIAVDGRGARATPDAIVWEALCEAIAVVEGLPDQERKWLRGGSGGWGMVGLTRSEAEEVERARRMMGLQPGDTLRAGITPVEVDRALSVCKWLSWCRTPAQGDNFHKVVLRAALGQEDAAVALWSRSPTSSRSSLKDIRAIAVTLMRKGLEADTAITFNPYGFTVGT